MVLDDSLTPTTFLSSYFSKILPFSEFEPFSYIYLISNASVNNKQCFDCQTATHWNNKELCGHFDNNTNKCLLKQGRDCYSFTMKKDGQWMSLRDCDNKYRRCNGKLRNKCSFKWDGIFCCCDKDL